MKPFGLDTVLEYRQRLEDIAKNTLAQARQQEQEIQQRLQTEQNECLALIAAIERSQQQGVQILELIRQEELLTYRKTQLKELEKEHRRRQERVARARKELLQKAQERQVLEKLKEKQDAEWRHHLNKKEAAMLDEIALIFRNR